MATNAPGGGSGLIWHPFPDPDSHADQQIWNAIWKQGNVGEGFGRICNYYSLYLVTVSAEPIEPLSFFYDPKFQMVFRADYGTALAHYHGNRQASASNVVALVEHLLAVNSYPVFVISNATDIPHRSFSKENPGRSFEEWLLSKGIVITPPALATVNKDPDWGGPGGDSEYNVFVYEPCGGQLFRYEAQCNGRESPPKKQWQRPNSVQVRFALKKIRLPERNPIRNSTDNCQVGPRTRIARLSAGTI